MPLLHIKHDGKWEIKQAKGGSSNFLVSTCTTWETVSLQTNFGKFYTHLPTHPLTKLRKLAADNKKRRVTIYFLPFVLLCYKSSDPMARNVTLSFSYYHSEVVKMRWKEKGEENKFRAFLFLFVVGYFEVYILSHLYSRVVHLSCIDDMMLRDVTQPDRKMVKNLYLVVKECR